MSNLYIIQHYIISEGDTMKILLVDLWRIIKYKGGAEKVFLIWPIQCLGVGIM